MGIQSGECAISIFKRGGDLVAPAIGSHSNAAAVQLESKMAFFNLFCFFSGGFLRGLYTPLLLMLPLESANPTFGVAGGSNHVVLERYHG